MQTYCKDTRSLTEVKVNELLATKFELTYHVTPSDEAGNADAGIDTPGSMVGDPAKVTIASNATTLPG